MAKNQAPICLNCRKRLAKQFYGTDWATETFKREPYQTKPTKYEPARLDGFYGHYGKDGHGRFCSYKCGYAWALEKAGGRVYYPPSSED